MELFKDTESYRMDTVVQDSRKYVLKNNPILPDETEEEYYVGLGFISGNIQFIWCVMVLKNKGIIVYPN